MTYLDKTLFIITEKEGVFRYESFNKKFPFSKDEESDLPSKDEAYVMYKEWEKELKVYGAPFSWNGLDYYHKRINDNVTFKLRASEIDIWLRLRLTPLKTLEEKVIIKRSTLDELLVYLNEAFIGNKRTEFVIKDVLTNSVDILKNKIKLKEEMIESLIKYENLIKLKSDIAFLHLDKKKLIELENRLFQVEEFISK